MGKHTAKKKRKKTGSRWKWLLLLPVLVVLASVSVFAWQQLSPSPPPQAGEKEEEEKTGELTAPEVDRRPKNPLTGLPADRFMNPTVVMISNIAQARPQTGLNKANIIYEVEMEGMITRFVALFYADPPEIAGPVRSARPYVMKFGQEWDAYFVHVGGSEDAKRYARTKGFHDIDGMAVSQGIFTDSARKRPHNTYVNFTELLEGRSQTGNVPELLFQDDNGAPAACRTIKLDYGKSNRIEYRWDEAKRAYARWLNAEPHQDKDTGEQLYASNVFIQYARHTFSGDELGHIDIKLVGEGKAEFYIGGQYMTGTWSKASDDSFTQYYDENGRELVRVRGNTIVQVVRSNKSFIGNADAVSSDTGETNTP